MLFDMVCDRVLERFKLENLKIYSEKNVREAGKW